MDIDDSTLFAVVQWLEAIGHIVIKYEGRVNHLYIKSQTLAGKLS